MEEKFIAVVYKSADYRDYDRVLKLITPAGARQAVMRGVKKPNARLRFASMPFAFCEYTAAVKNSAAKNADGFCTITGASQIEDLFVIASDPQKLTAGSIILESAFFALKGDCGAQFVYMLKRLKDIIYSGDDPFVPAVRFLQYIIHQSGYGYEYTMPEGNLDTPIKLLSALSFVQGDQTPQTEIDKTVLDKTLFKLIDNFEKKFEAELLSKKFLVTVR